MEEAVAAGRTLNQEQKEVMRSKPTLAVVIDELESLRASPPSAEEVSVSVPARPIASAPIHAAVRAKLDRIMASDYYTTAAVGGYGAEGVQAHESMAASPEASAMEENLAAEGHKFMLMEAYALDIL
ncbi:hypothetical protein ZWY2020_027576 [Hordeum vulgare]|nr:hypothetical protein ZWY2020_027576 [Hordeum vulgare]